ncbi:uncharacterized protein LOC131648264 isoform X2 [Vicia villosa]|uniref:uncharacterized protein LOC131648264 isoform X2 n=1 Tax=Vicia villosa TaxID=3911 RepID=UPI00273B8C58|nr:uncharacterized protein LOC131648264 isoform X2 [Vicia villosa]
MAGLAPEGSQFDAKQLSTDGQELITTYDEVYDTFDAMGLQENLLRGTGLKSELNQKAHVLETKPSSQILTKSRYAPTIQQENVLPSHYKRDSVIDFQALSSFRQFS